MSILDAFCIAAAHSSEWLTGRAGRGGSVSPCMPLAACKAWQKMYGAVVGGRSQSVGILKLIFTGVVLIFTGVVPLGPTKAGSCSEECSTQGPH